MVLNNEKKIIKWELLDNLDKNKIMYYRIKNMMSRWNISARDSIELIKCVESFEINYNLYETEFKNILNNIKTNIIKENMTPK